MEQIKLTFKEVYNQLSLFDYIELTVIGNDFAKKIDINNTYQNRAVQLFQEEIELCSTDNLRIAVAQLIYYSQK